LGHACASVWRKYRELLSAEHLVIYAKHSHTRVPIYKETVDNVIGIISAKDVLRAISVRGIGLEEPVADVMRDAYFVPETKRAAELFGELRQSGNHLGIVVDEFGGVTGLVTLKRLLEEVVGQVGEEGAAPVVEFEAIGLNTFQVDGGMSIDEVNQELEVVLPEGDFDTIAGFTLAVLGYIPGPGEQFEYANLKFEILEMQGLKIKTLKVTKRFTE
jgi:CBS domain containing-hemolysin-like protein